MSTTLTSLLSSPGPANNTTSASSGYEASSLTVTLYRVATVVSALEAVLILASNLPLLLLLVTSPHLRRQTRHQLVLSLVCNNLLEGIVSAPFFAHYTAMSRWVHGCYFRVVISVLAEYVQNFVTQWGMVALLSHHVAGLLGYEGPAWLIRLPAWAVQAMPALCVAAPWIAAVLIQLPVIFLGLHPAVRGWWSEGYCPVFLDDWASYLLIVVTYILSVVVIVVLVVVIVVRRRDPLPPGSAGSQRALVPGAGRQREDEKVQVVAAVLAVLMVGPGWVFYGFRLYRNTNWSVGYPLILVFFMLNMLLAGVLGPLWLLGMREVRARMLELGARVPGCAGRCRRLRSWLNGAESNSGIAVSFRNLEEQ